MNVNDAVQEMLAYLELSALAIDAVWDDEEETKGLEAVWDYHPDDETEALTMEELEEAMNQLSSDFPVNHLHPFNYAPDSTDGYNKVKTLKNAMPAIFRAEPKYMQLCPVPKGQCPHLESEHPWPIADIIIHLNDRHGWSRHAIADWLDALDIDLTFEVPEGGDE